LNRYDLLQLMERILDGGRISRSEAEELTGCAPVDIPFLAACAHSIREKRSTVGVDLCGVINARSGQCSEDCKFCAQSAHHKSQTPSYPLLSSLDILQAAQKISEEGAKRVSVVTSGKGMDDDETFERIIDIISLLLQQTDLKICANLGTISTIQAQKLSQIGVKRYAHNLETSERHFPNICTTHNYDERIATIRAARSAGMELCSGGIIGLGESWQDRLDMAFALQELEIESVPINILQPIPGTPLAKAAPLHPMEILKAFAIFRFILPQAVIRPAGGRENNLRDLQGAVMLAGANGLIIGNYLTFSGRSSRHDRQLVKDICYLRGVK